MSDVPGWLKHASVWLLVALAVFVGVMAWQREEAATRFTLSGGTLEIRRSADGHYHWPGSVNGRAVDFLVDTGATSTALPEALARELKLRNIGRVRSSTAGGVVDAGIALADVALQGGIAAERLRVATLAGLEAPLLGMDVLGRLQWRQERGVLHIEVPATP